MRGRIVEGAGPEIATPDLLSGGLHLPHWRDRYSITDTQSHLWGLLLGVKGVGP